MAKTENPRPNMSRRCWLYVGPLLLSLVGCGVMDTAPHFARGLMRPAHAVSPMSLMPPHIEEKIVTELAHAFGPQGMIMTVSERNALQNGLLSVADTKCSRYLHGLRHRSQARNTSIKILETAIGGAGMMMGDATLTRMLVDVTRSIRETHSQFEHTQFIHALLNTAMNGIETRRGRLKKTIFANQTRPMTAYRVQYAVADAVQYHQACNVGIGLVEADSALTLQHTPLWEVTAPHELPNAEDRRRYLTHLVSVLLRDG